MSTTLDLSTLPIRQIVLVILPLNLKVLCDIPVMLHPNQLALRIENHWSGMSNRVTSRGKEDISRIAVRTPMCKLDNGRLVRERDIAPGRCEAVDTEIIPAEISAQTDSTDLWNGEDVEQADEEGSCQ